MISSWLVPRGDHSTLISVQNLSNASMDTTSLCFPFRLWQGAVAYMESSTMVLCAPLGRVPMAGWGMAAPTMSPA